ncbi:MAG: flagellar hook-basal body complex protein [Nautiliaceae bacterium]
MTTSFYNGVIGLKSFQNGIDIWGDNISNVNTVGYKKSIPEFSTLFAQTLGTNAVSSDIGIGSKLSSTAMDTSQGSLIKTDNPFDLALDGEGWFRILKNNQTFYSRTGSFTRDANGDLVNDNGGYLLVANANNLIPTQNGYIVDRNVDTTNLTQTKPLSKISLPNNVILPALATKNVKIATNLNDANQIRSVKPASTNSYFSALYNKDGENMNIRDYDDFVYNVGEKSDYSNGVLSREVCINDDFKDGKEVNIDFSVNGVDIKLNLPDGSTKEEIQNALYNYLQSPDISTKLQEANIKYEKTTNGITFSTTDNDLKLISNSLFTKSSEAKVLVYKNNPINNNEFSTVNDLISQMQSVLNDVYPSMSKVYLEDNGQITVSNLSNDTIDTRILKASNTNEEFFNNLYNAANTIIARTSAKSSEFLSNSQSFGGVIYDTNGNKNTLSVTFTKKEVLNDSIIWEGKINISDNEGNLISSQTQDFTFNSLGNLVSSNTVKISSPQNITLTLNLTAYQKDQNAPTYTFEQDGMEEGHLKNYEITENGEIKGIFSNNQTVTFGQIPIFHFQNDQGLESMGDSLFKQTDNSNQAFLYQNNNTYIPGAKVLSSTLEDSNVNFTQAMTELIVTQKAFSSAAKAVTTSDEMIKRAIDMKQG